MPLPVPAIPRQRCALVPLGSPGRWTGSLGSWRVRARKNEVHQAAPKSSRLLSWGAANTESPRLFCAEEEDFVGPVGKWIYTFSEDSENYTPTVGEPRPPICHQRPAQSMTQRQDRLVLGRYAAGRRGVNILATHSAGDRTPPPETAGWKNRGMTRQDLPRPLKNG